MYARVFRAKTNYVIKANERQFGASRMFGLETLADRYDQTAAVNVRSS